MQYQPVINYGTNMPAVRIVIPLLAGIYTGYQWPDIILFRPEVLLGITVILWSLFLIRFKSMRWVWLQGAAMLSWLIIAGGFLMQTKQNSLAAPELRAQQAYHLTGLIDREPVTTRNGFRLKVKVLHLQNDHQIWRKPFYAWVYPSDLGSVHALVHGDTIRLNANIQTMSPATNPGEFDFKRWSNLQGVQQTFWQSRNDTLIYSAGGNQWSVIRSALLVRQQQINKLSEYMPAGQELAIVMAILLGKRDEIDHTLRQAYADTGAVHVLAVSGLHVGIVAFVLKWFLGLIIPKFHGDKWLRLALNLIGIWAFAFVTGLPPSVQRASIMFSLFILGTTLQKRRNGYNTLAIAAIIMLLINPLLIFDVGFQLSFSAVWGILLFFPRIYPVLSSPVQWLDASWSLLAVSISATIGTLPFTLFYFQQFPVLFWLSGLVVIPAATAIVWLGIGLLVFANLAMLVSIFSYPALLAATLLHGIIWVMNAVIFTLQSLPGAVLSMHNFSFYGLLCLLLMVLALAFWLKFRNRVARFSFYIAFFLVGGWYGLSEYKAWHQAGLVVYHTRAGNVADLLSKNQSISFFNDAGSNHVQRFDDYRNTRGASNHQTVHLKANQLVAVRFAGRQFKIGYLNDSYHDPGDILIPFEKPDELRADFYNAELLVLPTNPASDAEESLWPLQNMHVISDQGALVQFWK